MNAEVNKEALLGATLCSCFTSAHRDELTYDYISLIYKLV